MLFLDNDVLRKYARPEPDQEVVEYLAGKRSEPWALPAVVVYEFLSFYDTQQKRDRRHRQLSEAVDEIAAFDEKAAKEAATLESLLESAGSSLDPADLLIAATVRDRGGSLATCNANDFDKAPVHELVDVDIVDTE